MVAGFHCPAYRTPTIIAYPRTGRVEFILISEYFMNDRNIPSFARPTKKYLTWSQLRIRDHSAEFIERFHLPSSSESHVDTMSQPANDENRAPPTAATAPEDDNVSKKDLMHLVKRISDRLTDNQPSRAKQFLHAFPSARVPLRLNSNSMILYAH